MAKRGARTPKIKLGFKFNGPSLPFPKPEVSPEERASQNAARAKKAKALFERSDKTRYKAMLKKFGPKRAVELGVPQMVADATERAVARAARRASKVKDR